MRSPLVCVTLFFLGFVNSTSSPSELVLSLAQLVNDLIPGDVLDRIAPSLRAFAGDERRGIKPVPASPVPTVHIVDRALHAQDASPSPLHAMLAAAIREEQVAAHAAGASQPFSTALQEGTTASEYPYFGFIPKYLGAAYINSPGTGSSLQLPESRCWKTTTVTLENSTHDELSLKVTVSGNKGGILPLACSDFYIFSTVADYHLATFPTPVPGTKHYSFPLGKLSESELWDIRTKGTCYTAAFILPSLCAAAGVRLFRFRDDATTSASELAKTATMFTPLIGKYPVSPSTSASNANLEFLSKYRNLTMAPRNSGVVTLNESQIQDGDFFGVMRLDGLDPMLAWGMGSTTGHTLIAIRNPQGAFPF